MSFFFFLQQSRAIGTSLSRCPQEKITNSVYWGVLCLLVFLCFWIPPVNELAYICTFVLITMAYPKTKQFRMAPWKHDLYNNQTPYSTRPASKHEYVSKLTGFPMDRSWAVGGSVNCRITMSLSIFNQVKKSRCVWINTEPLYVNTPTLRVAEDCCTVCSNIFIMRILISTCQPTWLHHHFTLVLIPSITFFNTLGSTKL